MKKTRCNWEKLSSYHTGKGTVCGCVKTKKEYKPKEKKKKKKVGKYKQDISQQTCITDKSDKGKDSQSHLWS